MASHVQPREVFFDSGNISFTRTAKAPGSPPELSDFETKGYATPEGTQLVSVPSLEVSTTESGSELDITFTLDPSEGTEGEDYLIEYTVTDGTQEKTNQLFFQNGLYPARFEGDLIGRLSGELERLSSTFSDLEEGSEPTDFSDVTRRLTGDFQFVSGSSSYEKHGGEPVPYFKPESSSFELPESFSSREATIFLVLDFDRNPGQNFPVLNVEQGGNKYLEVRNQQGNVELASDFADSNLVSSSASGKVLVECRIDGQNVKASVNRKEMKTGLNLQGYNSGTLSLNFNAPVQLFDAIFYDEPAEIDRVSKQLSYLYSLDLTDVNPRFGSKVQNHLFFKSSHLDYDMKVATTQKLFEYSSTGDLSWLFDTPTTAVSATGSERTVAGTSPDYDVVLFGSDGLPVWVFEGHSSTVTSVLFSPERFVYSSSEDGTIKKISEEGVAIWNFGSHGGAVNDLAVSGGSVYSASSDQTVRKIDGGSETWSYGGHVAEVTSISVSRNEVLFSGAANGELRAVSQSAGNEIYLTQPYTVALTDVAYADGGLYVSSSSGIKRLDPDTGTEVWATDLAAEALAVSPENVIHVLADKVYTLDPADGSEVRSFEYGDGNPNDLSVQPGPFEPNWQ